ncbi:RNA exonuclease 3 [Acarospora aff. strigata]|nr:RNA exonuclease 3 [Acarospora aff. strigata]
MFSITGLFHQISCPRVHDCCLLNCIFSHDTKEIINGGQPDSRTRHSLEETDRTDDGNADGPRKRRRVDAENDRPEIQSLQAPQPVPAMAPVSAPPAIDNANPSSKQPASLLKTSTREVSPPPRRGLNKRPASTRTSDGIVRIKDEPRQASRKATKETIKETLNPRKLPHPPTSHTIRLAIVAKLHEQIVRLNEEVIKSNETSKKALELSPQEMISMALDEEEKTARESPSVYSNVIKLRIVALKKMKLEEWKQDRLKRIARDFPELNQPSPDIPAIFETNLTVREELTLLPKLFINQGPLQKFGYVWIAPSKTEIALAKIGIDAAQGWEQCDRCKTRFQVFPGRRAEDGALTTGGSCTYHHGKILRPLKERTDAITGHKEAVYSCCNEPVGASIGCTKADTHVFKVSEAKRLAAVLPFEPTPLNENQKAAKAVCFDCEMGYTVHGMELIRLTATAWPRGEELLDVLVRPIGEVLDLNSRFSGVWPRHFAEAVPYGTSSGLSDAGSEAGEVPEHALRLVESPAIARSLLFEFLTPETPLIGHAIENDLTATRIIHPSVIDTVVLYPHPRGLPLRYGLRMLVSKYLDRNIQMGGEQGHDSKEDARAAGDLARLKIGQIWKVMMREGWTMQGGVLKPPPHPSATPNRSKIIQHEKLGQGV